MKQELINEAIKLGTAIGKNCDKKQIERLRYRSVKFENFLEVLSDLMYKNLFTIPSYLYEHGEEIENKENWKEFVNYVIITASNEAVNSD